MQYRLEVIPQSHATISSSANVTLLYDNLEDSSVTKTSNTNNDDDNNLSTNTDDSSSVNTPLVTTIKVHISGGNVFHPHSNIFIQPPKLQRHDDKTRSNVISISIGENNLFDEECHVIIDLSTIYFFQLLQNSETSIQSSFQTLTTVEDEQKMESSVTYQERKITVIESYNHFKPKCYVKTSFIGNANIFCSYCHIVSSHIDYGNLFQSYSHVQVGHLYHIENETSITISSESTSHNKNDNNSIHDDDDESIYYDLKETVFFCLSREEDSILKIRKQQQQMRPHIHGMKKNMSQVRKFLSLSKQIISLHDS